MAYYINESCTGCSLCAKSCPVQAIVGVLKERHTVNEKRCVSCGVCGNVCNFSAVLDGKGNQAEKIPRKEWKKPSVDTAVCSACSMCVELCRFSCLQISKPKERHDINVSAYLENPAKCVACALCVEICPLNAIKMKEVAL